MKPPEQLTDEELRIEIAEFMGEKRGEDLGYTHAERKFWYSYSIREERWIRCSERNYPSSLDAMWEAEEKLHGRYKNCKSLFLQFYGILTTNVCKSSVEAIHATAKQRAIAFVKTIREIKKV